ncbi:HD domain-containing phosphohydrolase [Sulfurimonas sp.]|uniref:HD domain-containing phosphohydrolase n=1 Tax=Sulfurimonas sp. TaxID=2022749 RepID=UPI0025D4794D|nr:HD domain-containing phosphohydrolase [Sulfurimonas sp.]MDD5157563.1 HD domain-containing protein [Sulfurimonas sp.]
MKHARSLNANEILELVFIYLTEISSLRDHDDVIVILANMGRALTSSDRCSVWIADYEKQRIWTKVAHGMNPIELPMGSGLVGYSIASGKKIIVDDAYTDERFNPDVDKITGYNTKSMMVIPMFDNNDEIIGAFQVINNRGEKGTFDQRDMERLMLASTYAAESIISAMLAKEVEDTQKEVVFTMGAVAESRSKETGNHVKRVAEYSKILALASGMNEKEAELLKQASPMHDIGKIAIADSILNKPGIFTSSEFEIMKKHAELGHSMIKNSDRPLLKAASIVAHEHHEKWNGSGYPRGLSGEDIHIYGRITAIADVFDALGSDRVYKKAWDDEKIFNHFKEERGKHFDPNLIDIFFDNLDEMLSVREKFKDVYKDGKSREKSLKNHIKILGAYGTRLKGFGTTSFLLNETNVIDAGNLISPLEEKCAIIENIWLTHSHLDHISDIAYILDNYFAIRKQSLTINALPETIKILKKHFFNDLIWPDFSKIKLINSDEMAIKYSEIELNKEYDIGENESIEPFKTDHTVPSSGYIYKKNSDAVIITADTYSLDNLIEIIDSRDNITAMVIECSFPSYLDALAKESKHLTPKLLFSSLKKLKKSGIKLYINHIKPMYLKTIIDEIQLYKGKTEPIILKDSDIIEF